MNENNFWSFDTSNTMKGFTWWWFWWLFFIDTPKGKPRQLMILWSTKECNKIKIDNYLWERKYPIIKDKNTMKFNGVTAAWYFDGKEMHDPFLLNEDDFISEWNNKGGKLYAKNSLRLFEGGKGNYKVAFSENNDDFVFNMKPWTKFQSELRSSGKYFIGKAGYAMEKIYGSKFTGKINKENISGTAYFQKVKVNAPAVPWYWGAFHFEKGSYLDFFMPNFGLQCLRRSDSQKSIFDTGHIFMKCNAQFYHEKTGKHYKFKKIKIRKFMNNKLPVFTLIAKEKNTEMKAEWAAYTRACWKFKQGKSKLFYNEYPVDLKKFELRDGNTIIRKEDLGKCAGNIEHSWGLLL